jgi:hypothetical protein
MAESLQAALRDASWYRYPGRARSYHVWTGDGAPACRPVRVLLAKDSRIPAAETPGNMRCKRYGCAQLWPATIDRSNDE